MPSGFDACRAKGGKIRVVKPNATTYIPICYLGKKSFRGEVHKVKGSGSKTAEAVKERK